MSCNIPGPGTDTPGRQALSACPRRTCCAHQARAPSARGWHQLEPGELLAEAVARAELERAEGVPPEHVQGFALAGEPALRQAGVRRRSEGGFAVYGVGVGEEREAVGRLAVPFLGGREKALLASADGCGARERPDRFYDNGGGVW